MGFCTMYHLQTPQPVFYLFQLTECCVNVLVTAFKETILQECAGMIRSNETESKSFSTCVIVHMGQDNSTLLTINDSGQNYA